MKKSGDRVGRYIVERPLGAGGMGEVYEARDTRLGRLVAIKLLRSDAHASANQRFLREAQAAAAFEHPNAVVVYDAGEVGGEMYIAMELVRGKPLRSFVGAPHPRPDAPSDPGDGAPVATGERAPISIRRRLRWMIDVARALGAAHRAGLIHRDIKPDNIVVRTDGVIKVLDFGIARRQRARGAGQSQDDELGQMATVTAEGAIVGTPSYWSPEQLRGDEIDARADQFAWAITTYELLTGAPPWTAPDALALLSRMLSAPPPSLLERVPGLPEQVERAVRRALAKQPADRYPTIDEAADALEDFASAPASQARGTQTRSAGTDEVAATTNPRSGPSIEADAEATSGDDCCKTHESAPDPRTSGHDSGYARRTGGERPPRRSRRWARWAAVAAVLLGGGAAALAGTGVLGSSEPAAGVPRAEIPDPLTVPALICSPATLHGEGTTPELAAAIGGGACARLATNLGIEWYPADHPAATKGSATGQAPRGVNVDAQLAQDRNTITMSVGDRKATAAGATPMDAMVAVAAALSRELAAPAMSSAEIAMWGARDAESALRIQRTLRRMRLDFTPDDQAVARELLKSDPDSPWTHYIAFVADVGGAEGRATHRQRVIDLADKLPRGRALLLTALAKKSRKAGIPPDERKEILKRLRQAYAEAPDDPDLMVSVAVEVGRLGGEEASAVLDRLYERFPARSVWPMMMCGEMGVVRRDPEREGKLLERMRGVLPESSAWYNAVQYAVQRGDIDGARRAVEMGARLGATGQSSGNYYIELGNAWFRLATLDPIAAREVGTRMLSLPRDVMARTGSMVVLASYVLEGRVAEAQSMRLREIERFRGMGNTATALQLANVDLKERALMGQPAPSYERVSWMEEAAASSPWWQAQVRVSVALATVSRDKADRALKDAEAFIEKDAASDPLKRNALLLDTLPAVRILRGNAAAAKLWRETQPVSASTRRWVAFPAAIALEAIGDLAGAEEAYKLAMDPEIVEYATLCAMAAHVRLADLYRAQKRDAEAAALDAELDRAWAKADPGLRERIRAYR